MQNKNKRNHHIKIIIGALILSSTLLTQGCGNQVSIKPDLPEALPDSSEENSMDFIPDSDSETIYYESAEESHTDSLAPSQLQVNEARLMDNKGNSVQLKGISTHGLAWFPDYVNEDCFRQMRDEWNVNVIRLAMYTSEYGGYCNGGDQNKLKELVKNGVEYATALNMYVIIDWHILSDGNPNTYKEESKAFFAEMAKSYADHDNVLYEICNEPNGDTNWKDIKSYAEEVIPVIRSYDENGIIIVGTPNWSQYVDQAAADPIVGYNNIMYSLHFYAATHTDSLRNTMKEAIEAGLPVFVTEYGICDASGNGAINETQANQWINLMDEYGISYVAWNLSNKNETSAILISECDKVSGFTENDLSPSGKWLYQMLTEENADTSGETDPPSDNAPDNDSTPIISTAENNTPYTSEALSFTASLVNSWESEGKTFYQYNLTILNVTDTDCDQWAVDITFNDNIILSDSWNGNYSANGQTLHIDSKDYNSNIPSGCSTENIGFIIKADKGLNIKTIQPLHYP